MKTAQHFSFIIGRGRIVANLFNQNIKLGL